MLTVTASSALVNRATSATAPEPFAAMVQPVPDNASKPPDALARPLNRFMAGLPMVCAT
ncbi:hypothetical protein ACSSVY_004438 [Roseovarius sp. MBR-51]